MPRPVSEITGQKPRQLIRKGPQIRWTNEHQVMYLRLGGSRWLRELVDQKLKEYKESIK